MGQKQVQRGHLMEMVEGGLKELSLPEVRGNDGETWRAGKGYIKIPDREEAIRTAIRWARPRDTVLIAGKGHEDYQIIGKKKLPFDDRMKARSALEDDCGCS